MTTQRLRIRFRKEGDLRWISHRDLVRLMERMFRRARLQLNMSQGFHPKPRMSFPSALSLGIRAEDEVMELVLEGESEPQQVAESLRSQCPAGLVVSSVTVLPAGASKARVQRFVYKFPIPTPRRAQVEAAMHQFMQRSSFPHQRDGRQQPIDLRAGVEQLCLDGDAVSMTLSASREASVRPRELLDVLGLSDLESAGRYLTRTRVEIAP